MSRRPAITSIILLAVLCFTVSAQQKPTEIAIPVTPSGAAPTLSGSDLVVLRVSGEPITERQVMAAMATISKQAVARPDQQNKRTAMLFKGAVDNLVILTLLRAEARKQNLAVDKAKIDQQFEVLSKEPEFQKLMASRGKNDTEIRKNIEETLGAQELLDRAAKDLPDAKDAELQKIYDSNSFSVPERARVAQLFLKVEPNSTPEQKAEIKKKLEGIRADIESKKITFAEAANKFSQDPNGTPKDGDVGLVARNQVTIKPLEEAIFSTAPGAMTPVVEGPQGFHLINVIEIKPAGKRSFEEMKPMLQQQLKVASRQTSTRKYVEELKSKATIEMFMTAEEFEKRHPEN